MRNEAFPPIELPQTTKEKHLKRSFDNLLENLGLEEPELHEKRILDIGAGERYLAAYCEKTGINSDVFSVEPNLGISSYNSGFVKKNWPEIDKAIGEKTVVAKREALPFEDESFDLAINHAALPGKIYFKNGNYALMEEAIKSSFNEMMRILKSGGEAIIFPLESYPSEKAE
jgi:SAM-dependent methyltransferase